MEFVNLYAIDGAEYMALVENGCIVRLALTGNAPDEVDECDSFVVRHLQAQLNRKKLRLQLGK